MRTRWIIAAVLVVVGVGWIAQGLGMMPGSGFMDGDNRWALFGAVLAIIGVGLGWSAFRARSQP
jgi:hypothetical protein